MKKSHILVRAERSGGQGRGHCKGGETRAKVVKVARPVPSKRAEENLRKEVSGREAGGQLISREKNKVKDVYPCAVRRSSGGGRSGDRKS